MSIHKYFVLDGGQGNSYESRLRNIGEREKGKTLWKKLVVAVGFAQFRMEGKKYVGICSRNVVEIMSPNSPVN
jgi:hypothetical protein